jgi:hypothetical protein
MVSKILDIFFVVIFPSGKGFVCSLLQLESEKQRGE